MTMSLWLLDRIASYRTTPQHNLIGHTSRWNKITIIPGYYYVKIIKLFRKSGILVS